jgi:hypothetical protein
MGGRGAGSSECSPPSSTVTSLASRYPPIAHDLRPKARDAGFSRRPSTRKFTDRCRVGQHSAAARRIRSAVAATVPASTVIVASLTGVYQPLNSLVDLALFLCPHLRNSTPIVRTDPYARRFLAHDVTIRSKTCNGSCYRIEAEHRRLRRKVGHLDAAQWRWTTVPTRMETIEPRHLGGSQNGVLFVEYAGWRRIA